MKTLRNTTALFLLSEDGGATVDWVVLTAAVVGLGIPVIAILSGGFEDLSGDINTQLVSRDIPPVVEQLNAGLSAMVPRSRSANSSLRLGMPRRAPSSS